MRNVSNKVNLRTRVEGTFVSKLNWIKTIYWIKADDISYNLKERIINQVYVKLSDNIKEQIDEKYQNKDL